MGWAATPAPDRQVRLLVKHSVYGRELERPMSLPFMGRSARTAAEPLARPFGGVVGPDGGAEAEGGVVSELAIEVRAGEGIRPEDGHTFLSSEAPDPGGSGASNGMALGQILNTVHFA